MSQAWSEVLAVRRERSQIGALLRSWNWQNIVVYCICERKEHREGRQKSWEVLVSGGSDWWVVVPGPGFMGMLHVPLTGPYPSKHPGGLLCSFCSPKAEWPWSVKVLEGWWHSSCSFIYSFNPYWKPTELAPGHKIKAHSLLSSFTVKWGQWMRRQ